MTLKDLREKPLQSVIVESCQPFKPSSTWPILVLGVQNVSGPTSISYFHDLNLPCAVWWLRWVLELFVACYMDLLMMTEYSVARMTSLGVA